MGPGIDSTQFLRSVSLATLVSIIPCAAQPPEGVVKSPLSNLVEITV